MANGQYTQNRILWLDPNLANNVMVNPDDLSIKVEFNSFKKGRSIIYKGTEIKNSGGNTGSVSFINGSKVNEQSPQPSLTTRYTDAIALEVMNTNAEKADDFESLGIESIDIEFNTSWVPLIKIKFIDVRGNAILSQGTMSKYRMFFELPYPIFSLKVKGFYGGTVNYCLHMQRWNASFNSETGNFEIQADFMGYTYAMLTDLIMGLIRASVRTQKGRTKLAAKQAEYGSNSNLIITIDDMMKKFVDLNNSFNKISSEDDTASQLKSYDDIFTGIQNIRLEVDKLSNSIYDGNPPNNYLRTASGDVLCVPSNDETKKKYEDAYSAYTKNLTGLISTVNSKIAIESLKLNEGMLKDVVKISQITKKEIVEGNPSTSKSNVDIIREKSANKYTNSEESKTYIRTLLSDIGTLGTSSAPADAKIDIYNLKRLYFELDNKKKKLEEEKASATEDLAAKLNDVASDTVGFDPTIRNIFRVLCVNAEIFLEVLKEVSVEAQGNQKRIDEFKKLARNLNVKESDVNSNTVYPWPEYREEKSGEGFVETWLGSVPSITPSNINEVVFVEEMLKELLNVAKFDKELEEEIEENEAGSDIDSEPQAVEYPWYPLCSIDTPVNSLITENPYISATEAGNVDEAKRLLILRLFMYLGVGTYNSKMESKLIETMGLFEAENILSAARKHGANGQALIASLVDNQTKTDKLVTDLINFAVKGSDQITNPKGKIRPFMIKTDINGTQLTSGQNLGTVGTYYKYTYITKKDFPFTTAYIPINKSFDGVDFYNANGLKPIDQLKELSESVVFVSSPSNRVSSEFYSQSDGSLLFNIYELDQYMAKTMKPDFGSDLLEPYKAGITEQAIRVDSVPEALKNESNPNKALKGLEPLSGNYSALEISKLNYQYSPIESYNQYMGEPMWNTAKQAEKPIDSSIITFYSQYYETVSSTYRYFGTYLSYVITDKLKNNDVKSKLYETNDNNNNATIYFTKGLNQMLVSYLNRENRSTWATNGGYLQTKTLLSKYFEGNANLYLPFVEFGVKNDLTGGSDNIANYNLSLFGSYFYYRQQLDEVRALLFLHTIPWQGVKNFGDDVQEMMMFDKWIDWGQTDSDNKFTRVNSIRSMFQFNAGFIHAPKAWVLFIGGMLWRRRYAATNNNTDPIKYTDRNSTNTIYTLMPPAGTKRPSPSEYLYLSAPSSGVGDSAQRNSWGMFFGNDPDPYGTISSFTNPSPELYVPIDKTIINLPKDVRDKLIKYFEDWVNDSSGWQSIKTSLELVKGTENSDYAKWISDCQKVKLADKEVSSGNGLRYVYRKKLEEIFGKDVVDNYSLISAMPGDQKLVPAGNVCTVLKPGTTVMENMVSLLTTPVILQNANPGIWNHEHKLSNELGYETRNNSSSRHIRVRADKFQTFLSAFFGRLIKVNEDFQKEVIKTEDEEIKQEIFGTTDDKTIKLIIYRTLSSINDKWLNGSKDESPFSQCGASTQNEMDLKYARKFRGESAKVATLIDTFRFVDRALADIGDKFYIDINAVTDIIRGNYNQSFYDVVNKILTDNNFLFHSLPTFINFNNINELSTIFTPYTYNNPITFEGTGPAFVCCYVGQTSVNLDLGVDSVYPDDGLSIAFNNQGQLEIPTEAADFNKPIDANTLDHTVPVFAINYGQQNQNYFKSIKLDQREFTETMESLQVIESLSQQGDKSKPTYTGNNLFNVYQTRSYSAEVEMLGSAMIQPMMYFQLNNIPMFRGAYLIYKVSHSIKPHSMITTFKGNRVKKTKTPLIDKATMFMNLVGSVAGGKPVSSRSQASGNYPPIVRTIIDNGGTNGNIKAGKITTKPIPFDKLKGIGDPFNKKNNTKENILISEAVEPLINMLNDWVDWMRGNGFVGENGNKKIYALITSIFRDYDKQVQVKKQRGDAAAPPGTSPHGWGIAIDLQYFDKKGNIIDNIENTPEFFKYGRNPAIQWLFDHSYMYGWILPISLRDNAGNLDEHWHWEYHGTAAKCLVEKNPTVYGQKINTSGAVKDFVKNPKTPDGKEAVYVGCDYKYVKVSDGSEGDGNCPDIIKSPKVTYTPKQMYDKFKQKTNLNDFSIAGIMGNLFWESNFVPQAYNNEGGGCGAYGMAQWRGPRQKALANYAKSNNVAIDSIDAQIGYLFKELTNTYTHTLKALNNANSAELATKIFHDTFEATSFGVSGFDVNKVAQNKITYKDANGKTVKVITPKKRIDSANSYYNKIKSNTI